MAIEAQQGDVAQREPVGQPEEHEDEPRREQRRRLLGEKSEEEVEQEDAGHHDQAHGDQRLQLATQQHRVTGTR
jgi:hypothetical protein